LNIFIQPRTRSTDSPHLCLVSGWGSLATHRPVSDVSSIEHTTPALAILDYKLRDGSCTELAGILLQRGVPVIIYSGRRPDPDMPPELRHVPWLEKPLDRNALLAPWGALPPPFCPHPAEA
jgi:DNA-binding response OmpR family regulator